MYIYVYGHICMVMYVYMSIFILGPSEIMAHGLRFKWKKLRGHFKRPRLLEESRPSEAQASAEPGRKAGTPVLGSASHKPLPGKAVA